MQHHIFVLAVRLFPLSVVSSVVIQVLASVSIAWPRYNPLLPAFDALMSMLFPICFHDSASRNPNEVIHPRAVKSDVSRGVRGAGFNFPFLRPISRHSVTMLSL